VNASFPIVIAIALMIWGPIATIIAAQAAIRARSAEREARSLRRQIRFLHSAELRGRSATRHRTGPPPLKEPTRTERKWKFD
jgi:hypothetical protein